MGVHRHGDIDIGQDLKFQRRAWTFQRIGWSAMALVVVVALTGFFGKGPL